MTHKEIRGRLDFMNTFTKSRLGEEYEAHFAAHYGGWSMFVKDSGGCKRGRLGFDDRISTKEFAAYIRGIINALAYIR